MISSSLLPRASNSQSMPTSRHLRTLVIAASLRAEILPPPNGTRIGGAIWRTGSKSFDKAHFQEPRLLASKLTANASIRRKSDETHVFRRLLRRSLLVFSTRAKEGRHERPAVR